MDPAQNSVLTTAGHEDVAAYELAQDALTPVHERIRLMLRSLPVLGKSEVDMEEPCPICLVPFETVFAEVDAEEAGEDAEEDGDERMAGGVTKLVGCGHIFCRKDLTEWIRSRHGSCPTCRHAFLDVRPPSESDDESSDGGEYIPNPDDFEDEDEDAFLDTDAFTDASADEFPVEPMEIDIDSFWEDAPNLDLLQGVGDADAAAAAPELGEVDMVDREEEQDEQDAYADRSSEWGLTDGESDPLSSSEGDTSMEEEFEEEARIAVALEREVSVSVHEDEDALGEEGEGGLNAEHRLEQDSPK